MTLNGDGTPIKINGSNVNLGETLPRQIQEKLLHVAGTHFGRLNHGTVGFARDGHTYSCTINVHIGNLRMIVGEASAADCHQAFDAALAKVDKQLQRRKQRMVGSRQNQMPAAAL